MLCIYQRWASKLFFKFRKSQIRNSLGLIPLSQIRKFLRSASPQIANPQIFMINTQIANPQIFTKYCSLKIFLKVVFLNIFYVQILIRALYSIFARRKRMYLRACGSFKSANYKKDLVRKSQIRKVPQ